MHLSLLALPDLLLQGRGAQRNAAASLAVIHASQADARAAATAMATTSPAAAGRPASNGVWPVSPR